MAVKHPTCIYKGKRVSGKRAYRLSIKMIGFCLFKLPRKASRFKVHAKTCNRILHEIQDVGKEMATCITVSNQDGMFIAKDFIPTHNSVFCRNFLWRNMDAYPCFYFSSETSDTDFADYASRMTWAEPLRDGKPKFELIWRNKDWKDVIQPDAINIIDWLNLGDNFYQIGAVLEGIKERLNKGMCLIAIQKDPVKDLGMGGMWSEHLASLYLTMDFERLTVKKAKKWHGWNSNGKTYGFQIIDGGCHFANVRLLQKCACYGGKVRGVECATCKGTGFIDAPVR